MTLLKATLLKLIREFDSDPVDWDDACVNGMTRIQAYGSLPHRIRQVIPIPGDGGQEFYDLAGEDVLFVDGFAIDWFSFTTVLWAASPCVSSSFVYKTFLGFATSQTACRKDRLRLHGLLTNAICKLMRETRLLRSKRVLYNIAEATVSLSKAYQMCDSRSMASSVANIELCLAHEDIHRLDSDQKCELAALLLYSLAISFRIRTRLLTHAPICSISRLGVFDNSLFTGMITKRLHGKHEPGQGLNVELFRHTASANSAAGMLLSYSLIDVQLDPSSWKSLLSPLRAQHATRAIELLKSVPRKSIKDECVSSIQQRFNSSLFAHIDGIQVARELDRGTNKLSDVGFLLYMELVTILYASFPLWYGHDVFVAFYNASRPRFEKIAKACDWVSFETLVQTVNAVYMAWPRHDELKLAHVVHIALFLGRDRVHKFPEQLAEDLRRLFGRDASLMTRRLAETLIVAESHELINSLPCDAILAQPFIEKMALESGFVPSIGSWIDDGDLIIAPVDKAVGAVSAEVFSPKGVTKGWFQHTDSYKNLRLSSDWKSVDKYVGDQAELICKRLLSGERIVIANYLEENWFNDPRRVLIARRVLVGYSKHEQDYVRRLFQLGWLSTMEFKEAHLVDSTAYRQYCWQAGLPARALKAPLGSGALLAEEQDWLISFTFP